MDPVTQGAVGAIFAQAGSRRAQLRKAAFIGVIGGMAPDLDVLIRSATDPLLAIEFHRHFTHSLWFIPIGGLLCALALHWLLAKRWALSFRQTDLWATIGYATHGLLDSCTSYGTQLLWPLSNERFAWDIVSVVDPLFTVPLILLILMSAITRTRRYAVAGLVWGAMYLSLGYVQHNHATNIGLQQAEARGHAPLRLEAKPSFGNLLVWKVIYETDDRFYVDAVKPGWGDNHYWAGDSIAKLNLQRDFPWLDTNARQSEDVRRFRWFSNGYVAVDPNNPMRIIDIRYSMLPNAIAPLWGIELNRAAGEDEHVTYTIDRRAPRASLNALNALWGMIVK